MKQAGRPAKEKSSYVIALAGNPNVGKSTLFNNLTGMNQHTGNWPGKTVGNAQGVCKSSRYDYTFVDIPGTYSLMSHSPEEEIARNYICSGRADAVVVVCDATCLERNLNLVLQTMELSESVMVCVNLLDEAQKKQIHINLKELSKQLGVPVVGIIAREKKGLDDFLEELTKMLEKKEKAEAARVPVEYPDEIEEALEILCPYLEHWTKTEQRSRWIALRILEGEEELLDVLPENGREDFLNKKEFEKTVQSVKQFLEEIGVGEEKLKDEIVSSIMKRAEKIAACSVQYKEEKYSARDRRIDRFLTSKKTGYPVMILLLALVLWLTITGANYPSRLLSEGLFWVQDRLSEWFYRCHAPEWLHGIVVLGAYRVLAWVVSVMLPPMAIFFPLFTLLEDAGYLPRIAYNLDKPFQKCGACGKNGLTMCMGFGCNAAGVVGCRIIDSPRERLLAILTNNFVPCNGRFPTLIALITMFFVGTTGGFGNSILSALLLTMFVILGVGMTFAVSGLLSKTVLKGVPSSFVLELPPYRRPQIGKVIIRSVFDRTFFVLRRAVAVAIPAGMLIWILANVTVADVSLLNYCSEFLDPFARQLGLDGVILLAFILGFPANEIVIPIIIMAYTAQGNLIDMENLSELKNLLEANGWTLVTALCTMIFSMMHWPCSTTLLTIKKETGSLKWTMAAFLLPTVCGMCLCFLTAKIAAIF